MLYFMPLLILNADKFGSTLFKLCLYKLPEMTVFQINKRSNHYLNVSKVPPWGNLQRIKWQTLQLVPLSLVSFSLCCFIFLIHCVLVEWCQSIEAAAGRGVLSLVSSKANG